MNDRDLHYWRAGVLQGLLFGLICGIALGGFTMGLAWSVWG